MVFRHEPFVWLTVERGDVEQNGLYSLSERAERRTLKNTVAGARSRDLAAETRQSGSGGPEPARHQDCKDDVTNSMASTSLATADPNGTDIDHEIALGDQPLFIDIELPHMPVPVNDATDTAFATRFRQIISGPAASSNCTMHISRTEFVSDEKAMLLADTPCPWPVPSKARFLMEVALRHAGGCFHVVRKSCVLDAIERSFHDPSWRDPIMKCKIWALFSIGEVYSSRMILLHQEFPGLHYFAKATKILTYLGERPTLDLLEIRLLLSFYSLSVNRQYAAYTLAGSSVRMAVILGLHLDMTGTHLNDVALREHRKRLWWTTYIFDRLWSSKLGHPPAIHDDDMRIDLPSNPETEIDATGDFADAACCAAIAKLSSIITRVVRTVYGKSRQAGTLFNRVQQALKELKALFADLPPHLNMEATASYKHGKLSLMYLHLTLNQAIILSTRPILLHGLRIHFANRQSKKASEGSQPRSIHQSARTLIEACIRCARYSCRTLVESWIDGSFPTFDHLLTQYLFSALTVLAISSLMNDAESSSDKGQFEESVQLLEQLKDSGNFSAQELFQHVKALLDDLEEVQTTKSDSKSGPATVLDDLASDPSGGQSQLDRHTSQMATAEMALAEPSMQELLMQSDLDMQLLDSMVLDDTSGFYWPDIDNQGWVTGLGP
ncbi:fungal specific transcription factor [Colletotrichum truncatum]|uniref:Fungal specific transcription factor n=1 Tax=Colletotrichum truncatum TaxID=5467 RepID=A0ACC3YKB1_COLTU